MGKPDETRVANDRIIERDEQLRFVSRVPLLCECSDRGCAAIMLLGIPEYHEIRPRAQLSLTLPGHRIEGARLVEERDGYWLQQR